MSSAKPDLRRFRGFVGQMTDLVNHGRRESEILDKGNALLAELVSHDDWLPERYARPHPDHYQQYLLHRHSDERFCSAQVLSLYFSIFSLAVLGSASTN